MLNESLSELLDLADENHPEIRTLIQEIRGELLQKETILTKPNQQVFEVDAGIASLTQAVNTALALNNSVVLSIAGSTGSGKTTVVAEKIAENFDRSLIISTDHFYKGNKEMKKTGVPNWDHPDAVNLDLANKAIMKLAAGETAELPVYSKAESEPISTQWLEPQRVIIVEGLFVLDGRINATPGMNVYVHVPFLECMRRRISRDLLQKRLPGRTLRSEFEYIWGTVRAMHEAHVKPTANSADWIITNGDFQK